MLALQDKFYKSIVFAKARPPPTSGAAADAAAADAPELELSESVEQCKSLLF